MAQKTTIFKNLKLKVILQGNTIHMGRIKSKLVKRTGRLLLKEENKFNDNFEENKKFLTGLTPSKKIKNKIAGYIVRLKRQKE